MLKFLSWEASQFILTQPSWYWLCYCSPYKIYGRVIQRSQDELGRVVQGVVHNINKDTICPEDSMIEDLAQFHLFLKFPVIIVLLRLAVGQVSQCSVVSCGGCWAAVLYGQCMVVVLNGVHPELLVVLKVRIWCEERGTPGLWAIKRFGCMLPYTRSVVV